MKSISLKYVFFILCFFVYIDSSAQPTKKSISINNSKISNSLINTGIFYLNPVFNTYQINTKFLKKLNTIDRINEKIDSLYAIIRYIEFRNEIAQKNLVEKSNENDIKSDSINKLKEEVQTLTLQKQIVDSAYFLLKIKLQDLQNGNTYNKYQYLPLGIHQFSNNQVGKGILFSVTQVGLLGAGIGLSVKATQTYSKYKNLKAVGNLKHNLLYKDYKRQYYSAIGCFAGMGLMIVFNYFDNFNWFINKKQDKKVGVLPNTSFDSFGNAQMNVTMNINF